jgi:hypothetical protein
VRKGIRVRKYDFSVESQERLREETFRQWRALGPAAVWQAMYDLLDWWFLARGLDPEAQRVDRTHVEIRRVPWYEADTESTRAPDNLL